MVDDLWDRIGDDGLPPLAKVVRRGDRIVGRVVDLTEYDDVSPGQPSEPRLYGAELLRDGSFVSVGENESFTAAVELVLAAAA